MSLDDERPGLAEDEAVAEEERSPDDAFAPPEGGEHGESDAAGVS